MFMNKEKLKPRNTCRLILCDAYCICDLNFQGSKKTVPPVHQPTEALLPSDVSTVSVMFSKKTMK
jgi:hypothetical protein